VAIGALGWARYVLPNIPVMGVSSMALNLRYHLCGANATPYKRNGARAINSPPLLTINVKGSTFNG
jgi:hypothetical protein